VPAEPCVLQATVSAVMAVYNGEATVAEAIASMLAQTLPPLEIIVVDDGSDDGTPAILDGLVAGNACVRRVRQDPNAGQAAALNRGIAQAQGSYLAFLDADDIWMPDKLECQLALLAADPDLDVVYGLARQRWVRQGDMGQAGSAVPAYLPGAMLIRRPAFDRVGPFDTQYHLGSVVDWYARSVEAKLRSALLQQVVYERRIHGRNLGIVAADKRTDYLSVIKAALDRRRG